MTQARNDEAGTPVPELAELGQTPSRGFFAGIRRGIERRRLAADASELSWSGVGFLVLEILGMLHAFFSASRVPDRSGPRPR